MADTKGRTRAAKKKANIRMRQSIIAQEEEEVQFHPQYEEEISRYNRFQSSREGDESHDESVAHQSVSSVAGTSAASADKSQRIDMLERDVGLVNSKVDNIDAKLDLLIAAANPSRHSSTPRRPHPGPVPLSPTATHLPPPRQLRQDANRTGYVDHMLEEEKFRAHPVEGKTHLAPDIFTESLLPKPYMYATREGCTTLKQKLEVRTKLSAMEYINAALSLVNDKRAVQPRDRDDILRHLQDVTHDAMERPWEFVRRWTQHVWDAVEAKEITWADDQSIQNRRIRIAITGGGGGSKPAAHAEQDSRGSKTEVICRPFNNRAGCRQRSHHDEGQVRWLHICSFCDSVGRHCTGHNAIGCNNKLMYPGHPRTQGPNPHQPQFQQPRVQGPETQNWRYPNYNQGHNTHFQQFPKNA